MTAEIIDGKKMAESLKLQIAEDTLRLKKTHNITPGLAVVLVGDDPASNIYVNNKEKAAHDVGFQSFEFRLPAETTEEDLLALIRDLNKNDNIDGILVQSPVPKQIDYRKVIETISPQKDVDGFHRDNAGMLFMGHGEGFIPCTPLGCMLLLKKALFKDMNSDLSGKHAVIIGRSNIVGKPMAMLLLQENATVTIVHSKTTNLAELTRQADILIAATGKANLVSAHMVKAGAVVIDVGINRITDPETGQTKLVGDVDFENVKEVASAITPVPGGVGPMTIACLLLNTLAAAHQRHGITTGLMLA